MLSVSSLLPVAALSAAAYALLRDTPSCLLTLFAADDNDCPDAMAALTAVPRSFVDKEGSCTSAPCTNKVISPCKRSTSPFFHVIHMREDPSHCHAAEQGILSTTWYLCSIEAKMVHCSSQRTSEEMFMYLTPSALLVRDCNQCTLNCNKYTTEVPLHSKTRVTLVSSRATTHCLWGPKTVAAVVKTPSRSWGGT